jgi:hypothetical protein
MGRTFARLNAGTPGERQDVRSCSVLKKHGIEFDPKYVLVRCRTYGAHDFFAL